MKETQIKTIATQRNQNLDLVKIISCFAVVGMHTIRDDRFLLSSIVYQFCSFAIPCFLMASGYLLLNRKNINGGYCLRKIVNIFRFVVIWNAAVYLANIAKDIYSGESYQVGFASYGLEFIKNTFGSFIQKGSLVQFWYLGTLILLYMFLPTINSLLNRVVSKKKKVIYAIVLLALSFLVQIISYIVGTPIQKYVIQTFRLWTWLMYFVIGGFIPMWFNHLKDRISFQKHMLLVFIVTIAVVWFRLAFLNGILHTTASEYFYDSVMTVIWTVLLFTFVLRMNLKTFSVSLVKKLSSKIMGIYACHLAVRSVVCSLVHFDGLLALLVQTVMVGGISFAVSYILGKLPFGKYFLEI